MSITAIARLTPIAAVFALAACGTSSTSISTKTVTVTGSSTSSTSTTSSATSSDTASTPATSDSTPAPSTTQPAPSATGSPVKPTPVVLKPLITTYSASQTTVACSAGGPGFPAKLNWDITFTWSTKHAKSVYFGIDTTDAVHNSYSGAMPPHGSVTVGYGCYNPQTYTLAAVGTDGRVVQQTINVKNVGDPGA